MDILCVRPKVTKGLNLCKRIIVNAMVMANVFSSPYIRYMVLYIACNASQQVIISYTQHSSSERGAAVDGYIFGPLVGKSFSRNRYVCSLFVLWVYLARNSGYFSGPEYTRNDEA